MKRYLLTLFFGLLFAAINVRAAEDGPRAETALIQESLRAVRFPRLSFDAMPLGDVLETLAASAEVQGRKINLVRLAPKGDDPKVTISLRDVDLDRALYYISQSVGFRCEVEADAVILRPSPDPGLPLKTGFYEVGRSALVRLAGLPGARPDANTANKASAPDTAPTQLEVEKAVRSFLERAGVPFDNVPGATLALGSGLLIVTNTQANLDKVAAILARYKATRQVEIGTRFLEVDQADLDEFGIQWGLSNAASARGSRTAVTLASANRTLATSLTGTTTSDQIVITGLDSTVGDNGTITQDLSAPAIAGGIDVGKGASPLATVSGVIGAFDVDAVVNVLSRKSGTNLLSSPRLTVLSGERAEITVAQEMIYPRSYGDADSNVSRGSLASGGSAVSITAGTPRDFAKRNVGVEMGVTAVVEENGGISMTLEPCVTEFEGFVEYGGPSIAVSGSTTVSVPSGYYQPVFSVRRIRTEVSIDNGATIIMGGLTREEVKTVKDKIPILGDIPFLGRFFRNEGTTKKKKDLLIFVTASSVSPGGAGQLPAPVVAEPAKEK
jgi:general secretion pathway protein D